MKNLNRKSIASIAFISLSFLAMTSCTKEKVAVTPTPDPTPDPTPVKVVAATALKGDSIASLPFRIIPSFFPSGFYQYTDSTVTFGGDTCVTTPGEYPNQCLRITYKYLGGYWGAGFLNNNNWSATLKIKPTVKKMTFSIYTNGIANVTFLPFGTDTYGKKELYKTSANINAAFACQTVEIPIS